MIDANSNCLEVRGKKILLGIPIVPSENFVGNLPIDCRDFPVNDRLEVAWVQFSKQREKVKLFSCAPERSWRKGFIVYFEVWKLNFGGLPYLNGLDVWPGGEGEKMWPFWKSSVEKSGHRNINHAQIWLLQEGASLSICDQFGGLRVLKFSLGKLMMYEPTLSEVVAYFRKHTNAPIEKHRTWASRNINLLLDSFPEAEGKS